jgi:hypothetical protein
LPELLVYFVHFDNIFDVHFDNLEFIPQIFDSLLPLFLFEAEFLNEIGFFFELEDLFIQPDILENVFLAETLLDFDSIHFVKVDQPAQLRRLFKLRCWL